ncbi:RHS repeat domain-containing protein, partial [Rodentibacter caecimuris]|uniref:RHS repeat domain-containing protein n=1 Tax=Rodentibacter caecimuris TaxID=1796644 RepID=UPI002248E2CE
LKIQNAKTAHKNDRTFTYIYTHPDSYEPLAQCIGRKDENDNRIDHEINYFHCDQIGIPREMTDSQGKLIWRGRYDAWGGLHYDRHLAQQNQGHQPFRLQNQYIDQETGLHYNFQRYYEPITGRFISQDPIGLAGGNNLYRFEGTVQNQIDPLGLFVQAIVFAPELIALGKAALVTLGIFGVGVVAEEAMKSQEQTSSETKAESTSKCDKTKCPPCKPYPVGTIGYQGTESHERGMFAGQMHYHIFEVQQNPNDCKCRWKKGNKSIWGHQYFGAIDPSWVDLNSSSNRPPNYPH